MGKHLFLIHTFTKKPSVCLWFILKIQGHGLNVSNNRQNGPNLMNAAPKNTWERNPPFQADKYIKPYGKQNYATNWCLLVSKQICLDSWSGKAKKNARPPNGPDLMKWSSTNNPEGRPHPLKRVKIEAGTGKGS